VAQARLGGTFANIYVGARKKRRKKHALSWLDSGRPITLRQNRDATQPVQDRLRRGLAHFELCAQMNGSILRV